MAKLVTKKRKLKVEAFATLFLVLSIFLYLGAATALKSYNVILTNQAEQLAAECDEKKEAVASLETAVKELSNPERIAQIAEKAGIKANQANVKIMDAD